MSIIDDISTDKISRVPVIRSPVTQTRKYEIVWKTFIINTKQIYTWNYTRRMKIISCFVGNMRKSQYAKLNKFPLGKKKNWYRVHKWSDEIITVLRYWLKNHKHTVFNRKPFSKAVQVTRITVCVCISIPSERLNVKFREEHEWKVNRVLV